MEVLTELDELEAELLGAPGRLAALTAPEVEVLRLMAMGAPNASIGVALGISQAGVGSHVARILRKLGVANRTEAVSLLLATPVMRARN
jgi:DNA-binding CsgD family transcriptional regulator